MVNALPHISIRDLEPQLGTGLVKTGQAVLGHGGPFAVDERDPPVAIGVSAAHQRL